MTGLTRRSLLRTVALAPLIIPGRALSRLGGAAAPVGPGPSCGTTLPVPSNGVINSSGCYALTSDNQTVGNGLTISANNVTVLGNGHAITGTATIGVFGGAVADILIQDLTTDSHILLYGNSSTTQTSPAVHLNHVTYSNLASNPINPVTTIGNNIFIEHCAVHTYPSPSNPPPLGADDPLLVNGVNLGPGNYVIARWVVVDSSTFGPNFDVGIEGVTGGWDHCTISNCISTQGTFGGIGGWYAYTGTTNDGNCGFTITNCTFTGNTVTSWRFCTPQNPSDASIGSGIDTATSDAAANTKWGTSTAFGNVFATNTYVALTRAQCAAQAALFEKYRRHPPPQWPKSVWSHKIPCP